MPAIGLYCTTIPKKPSRCATGKKTPPKKDKGVIKNIGTTDVSSKSLAQIPFKTPIIAISMLLNKTTSIMPKMLICANVLYHTESDRIRITLIKLRATDPTTKDAMMA
jgi:hypothetical protein